ncbi:hypothetical protein HK102_002454 [Quaeritorhiza haematococci]|nr:hypothetical protein HK102_002454 [Quaeritorhiza haematococci]
MNVDAPADADASASVVAQSATQQLDSQSTTPTATPVTMDVPVEILNAVFSHVSDKHDLLSCCVVSKFWYQAAVVFLWNRVACYTDDWDTLRALLSSSSSSQNGRLNGQKPGGGHQQSNSLAALSERLRHPSPPRLNPNSNTTTNGQSGGFVTGGSGTVDRPKTTVSLSLSVQRSKSQQSQRTPPDSRSSGKLDRRHHIQHLRLITSSLPWGIGDLRPAGIRRILQGCPRLVSLELDCPAVNDDDLWVISKACPNLASLSLVSSAQEHARITDEGLEAIAANCGKLRHLRLRTQWMRPIGVVLGGGTGSSGAGGAPGGGGGVGGPGGGIHGGVGGGGVVNGFSGNDIDNGPMSGRGVSRSLTFTDRGIRRVATAYQGRLLTFALEWVGNYVSVPSESSESANGSHHHPGSDVDSPGSRMASALRELIESNPGLENLSLDWPIALDDTLEIVADSLRCLRKLRVGNAHKLDALTRVISSNRHLMHLSLYELNATTDPTHVLAPLLPPTHETEVHMDEGLFGSGAGGAASGSSMAEQPDAVITHEVSSLSISSTTNNSPPRRSSPSLLPLFPPDRVALKELELDGIGFMRSLLPLVTQFRYLTRLVVSPSRRAASLHHQATDDLVTDIAESCRQLVHLEVPIIGDGPLFRIAQNCLALEYLDVVQGREITDYSVVLLAKSCTRLQTLQLGSAGSISDNSIVVLARSLGRQLRFLTLPYGNRRLTVKSLEALAEHCDRLEGLKNVPAAGTSGISFVQLLEILPKFPRLLVVGVCWGGAGSAIGPFGGPGRYHLSREEQEQLKAACKRLRQVIHNG